MKFLIGPVNMPHRPGGFCYLGVTYCYEHAIRPGKFLNINICLLRLIVLQTAIETITTPHPCS